MISPLVPSIFPCSPLLSGTWWTPGLSIPWCCCPLTSFSACLVFFPLSLCRYPSLAKTLSFTQCWERRGRATRSSHLFFRLPCLLPPFTVPCWPSSAKTLSFTQRWVRRGHATRPSGSGTPTSGVVQCGGSADMHFYHHKAHFQHE